MDLFTGPEEVGKLVEQVDGVEKLLQTSRLRQAWKALDEKKNNDRELKRKGLEDEGVDEVLGAKDIEMRDGEFLSMTWNCRCTLRQRWQARQSLVHACAGNLQSARACGLTNHVGNNCKNLREGFANRLHQRRR